MTGRDAINLIDFPPRVMGAACCSAAVSSSEHIRNTANTSIQLQQKKKKKLADFSQYKQAAKLFQLKCHLNCNVLRSISSSLARNIADESLYFNTAGCDVRSVHIREGIHESSDQVCLRHINGEFEISICLLEPIDVLESPAPVKMDRFYAHHDQPVGIVDEVIRSALRHINKSLMEEICGSSD
ncbi:hypothetical protein OUZ56_006490 [Daphnia magna]|uniref:Uncharacterized protein n=1 Tax=Daphnia magna TaxID=35525 RepID=A0ABQ9YVT8_9CRUS|nr:hypothetical protein OUZ56_006490 [Daphnia magna]